MEVHDIKMIYEGKLYYVNKSPIVHWNYALDGSSDLLSYDTNYGNVISCDDVKPDLLALTKRLRTTWQISVVFCTIYHLHVLIIKGGLYESTVMVLSWQMSIYRIISSVSLIKWQCD